MICAVVMYEWIVCINIITVQKGQSLEQIWANESSKNTLHRWERCVLIVMKLQFYVLMPANWLMCVMSSVFFFTTNYS